VQDLVYYYQVKLGPPQNKNKFGVKFEVKAGVIKRGRCYREDLVFGNPVRRPSTGSAATLPVITASFGNESQQ